MYFSKRNATFVLFVLLPFITTAKTTKKHRPHEAWVSWGYNTEWYTRSNLQVSAPDAGYAYTIHNVQAQDHKGWDHDILGKQLTIPQYNYRMGYMIDEKHGWGVEANFDHTKYIIRESPTGYLVTGIQNYQPVNGPVPFTRENGFWYYLNNGANFLLFNVVKRWQLIGDKKDRIRFSAWGRAGVGPVIPHVENSLFGHPNHPHFQIGGWNTGVEASIRATFFRYVYLEYANKLDYARYSGLRIYGGTAKQAFGTYEMILSLGARIPLYGMK